MKWLKFLLVTVLSLAVVLLVCVKCDTNTAKDDGVYEAPIQQPTTTVELPRGEKLIQMWGTSPVYILTRSNDSVCHWRTISGYNGLGDDFQIKETK